MYKGFFDDTLKTIFIVFICIIMSSYFSLVITGNLNIPWGDPASRALTILDYTYFESLLLNKDAWFNSVWPPGTAFIYAIPLYLFNPSNLDNAICVMQITSLSFAYTGSFLFIFSLSSPDFDLGKKLFAYFIFICAFIFTSTSFSPMTEPLSFFLIGLAMFFVQKCVKHNSWYFALAAGATLLTGTTVRFEFVIIAFCFGLYIFKDQTFKSVVMCLIAWSYTTVKVLYALLFVKKEDAFFSFNLTTYVFRNNEFELFLKNVFSQDPFFFYLFLLSLSLLFLSILFRKRKPSVFLFSGGAIFYLLLGIWGGFIVFCILTGRLNAQPRFMTLLLPCFAVITSHCLFSFCELLRLKPRIAYFIFKMCLYISILSFLARRLEAFRLNCVFYI